MDSKNKLIIRNLYSFMNEEYFSTVFTDKEIKSIKMIRENQLPKNAIFTLNSNEGLEKVKSKYIYYPNLNLKVEFDLEITEQDLIETANKSSVEIIFHINYDLLIKTVYERNVKETQGLIYTDKAFMLKQEKTISYILKNLGSNIIKGKSIMNISLPVDIFDKRSLLQLYAYEFSFAPYYLERAALCSDYQERLRFTSAFLISKLYLSPMQSKPFNPIIGETFQCELGRDTVVYFEHTVHSPPTSNFILRGVNYTAHGYIITEASIGANSVKARKTGKFIIKFNDGTIFNLHYPSISIKGINIGKRTFNLTNAAIVTDETHKIAAFFKFNPDLKGAISQLFSSSQKSYCDSIRGQITKLDSIEYDFKKGKHKLKKNAECIQSITGEWTGWLKFDKLFYWEKGEYPLSNMHEMRFTLPSDSKYRIDLIEYIKKNAVLAQEGKDKLEDIQRKDRKLREKK